MIKSPTIDFGTLKISNENSLDFEPQYQYGYEAEKIKTAVSPKIFIAQQTQTFVHIAQQIQTVVVSSPNFLAIGFNQTKEFIAVNVQNFVATYDIKPEKDSPYKQPRKQSFSFEHTPIVLLKPIVFYQTLPLLIFETSSIVRSVPKQQNQKINKISNQQIYVSSSDEVYNVISGSLISTDITGKLFRREICNSISSRTVIITPYVFKYLNAKDLCNVSEVCQIFYYFASSEELWLSLYYKRFSFFATKYAPLKDSVISWKEMYWIQTVKPTKDKPRQKINDKKLTTKALIEHRKHPTALSFLQNLNHKYPIIQRQDTVV